MPWRSASNLSVGWSPSRRPRQEIFAPSAATAFTTAKAQAMIAACLEASRATQDPAWSREAKRAFEWFLGRNDLGLSLYDSSTGGCADGLHQERISRNQGA